MSKMDREAPYNEWLWLGGLLGACHALAELVVLLWYGAEFKVIGVAILTVSYTLVGVLVGLGVDVVVTITRLISSQMGFRTGQSFWRQPLVGLTATYAVVGCLILVEGGIAWPAVSAIFGVWLTAGWIVLVAGRRDIGWVALLLILCGLTLSVSALVLFQNEFGNVADDKVKSFGLGLLVMAIAPLLLGTVIRRKSTAVGGEYARPFLTTLVAVVAIHLVGLNQLAPHWKVREEPLQTDVRPAEGAPNIVIVVLDTVRSDHLGLFGYQRDTMPLLAEFARDCAVVTEITATAPGSLPSHGSMFTGMYSSKHGGHKAFVDDPDPPPYGYFMRSDVPTLAEWLTATGYRTGGISGNYGVLSSYGLGRGFEHFDAESGAAHLSRRLPWVWRFNLRGLTVATALRRVIPDVLIRKTVFLNSSIPPYRRANMINDRALEWLAGGNNRPFFLFLNYFDAHQPYLPIPELDQRFASRPEGLAWTGFPYEAHRSVLRGSGTFGGDELHFLEAQYDAELVFVDRELSRMLRRLKESGDYDDSLIIVTSDHGEAFMEHGFLGHSGTLYDPQISVPLLIKLPQTGWEAPAPLTTAHLQFVDFFPTIMAGLGYEVPPAMQGAVWAAGRGHALSENFWHFRTYERLRRELFAVRIGDWKWIHSTEGTQEAYDLSLDPAEMKNLLGNHRDLEEAARAIHMRRNEVMVEPQDDVEDATTIERLRSLGYVE